MGELIVLNERFAGRSRPAGDARPGFFFDLGCPFSYLAAERVEWILGDVEWVPTAPLERDEIWAQPAIRAQAERRAAELRLPLLWPDRVPRTPPARSAPPPTRRRREPEPEAAGMRLEALQSTRDPSRDGRLQATAPGLPAQGIRRLPAIRVGRSWFKGERALAEAAALTRARAAHESPLAPAGGSVARRRRDGSPLAPAG